MPGRTPRSGAGLPAALGIDARAYAQSEEGAEWEIALDEDGWSAAGTPPSRLTLSLATAAAVEGWGTPIESAKDLLDPRREKERSEGGRIALALPVPHPLPPHPELRSLYVLPPALRPVRQGRHRPDEGINRAYRRVLEANRALMRGLNSPAGPSEPATQSVPCRRWRALVEAVAALVGFATKWDQALDTADPDRQLAPGTWREQPGREGSAHRRGLLVRDLDGNLVWLGLRRFAEESRQWRVSLLRRLDGKTGLLRGSLLGKRVDFSGRAVIVPDPELPFGACRLPEAMAGVWRAALSSAARCGETGPSELESGGPPGDWPAEYPVLLNRAPSLHRYNLLAFCPDPARPTWEAPALGLHPLACAAFAADFDGDTMAVHVPLTPAAREEAREKLSLRQHLFSVANGQLLLHLSQDIVAGVWLRTQDAAGRRDLADRLGDPALGHCVGPIDAAALTQSAARWLRHAAQDGDPRSLVQALQDVDDLMGSAFAAASEGGLSVSLADLVDLDAASRGAFDPAQRADLAAQAGSNTERLHDRWEEVLAAALKRLPLQHPLAAIVRSGARGKVRQLVVLRGAVTAGAGTAAPRDYLEGLTPHEYWAAAGEARREMMPKKLNTPQGGELTRHLIHALWPVRIVADECSDTAGFPLPLVFRRASEGRSPHLMVVGRHGSDPQNGYGGRLGPEQAEALHRSGSTTVAIFSPLTCRADGGLCARCWGDDPATGNLPPIGTPVGLIAAGAIGERATQEFLQAFHGTDAGDTGRYHHAKRVLQGGDDPEGLPGGGDAERAAAARLAWLVDVYDSRVDVRHFEVVLRRLQEFGTLSRAADLPAVGPLAAAAFRSPAQRLFRSACHQAADSLVTPPGGLVFGGLPATRPVQDAG